MAEIECVCVAQKGTRQTSQMYHLRLLVVRQEGGERLCDTFRAFQHTIPACVPPMKDLKINGNSLVNDVDRWRIEEARDTKLGIVPPS